MASRTMTKVEKISLESIPLDLFIEIFKRLPTRSIARCRCVSKLWPSMLNTQEFIDSYFTISLSRPKLLFSYRSYGKTFFFTSPQPQNSSPITAEFQMSFPINCPCKVYRPVRGLVCGLRKQRNNYVPLLCNPSTRQLLTLPEVKEGLHVPFVCLGYDAIDKLYKLLCVTVLDDLELEYQVLTLQTGEKPSWKVIQCDIPHYPCAADMDYRDAYYLYDDICINGVCYYSARFQHDEDVRVIVSFDFRSEKFKSIRIAQGMSFERKCQPTLVNYKGTLAKLQFNNDDDGIHRGFQLWVLKDAEKHEWSNYVYDFPPRNDELGRSINFAGTTGTGEIVLSFYNVYESFPLLYYNTGSNTIRRVEIKGMKGYKIDTFLDHVENVKLLESI